MGTIAITGGPSTGKTTYAQELSNESHQTVFHTDDLNHMEWSDQSLEATKWVGEPNSIIEGVAVARTLRKWMKANPGRKPVDQLIVMMDPHEDTTSAQQAMSKGHDKVLLESLSDLERYGVEVIYK